MTKRASYNEGFDLIKAILAVLVVAIHTVALTKISIISFVAIPIVRLAVPIFFIFSGYFFFKRLQGLSAGEQLGVLKKSVIRYLALYGLWFVVTAPVTFKETNYFINGFWLGIKQLGINFVFGSTFIASWYIMGLILGIPLVYLFSRFLNNKILLVIAFLFNAFAVLLTNYGLSPLGQSLLAWLHSWPIGMSPSLNFMVGLLWIVIGKMFADGDLDAIIKPRSFYLAIGAMFLLYVEELIVHRLHYVYYNDCFFMLIPVCVLLFGWILTINISVPHARTMRAFSTIAYCFHASFAVGVKYLLLINGIELQRFSQTVLLWAFTVMVSVLLTVIILRLEKIRGFRWLRFSH